MPMDDPTLTHFDLLKAAQPGRPVGVPKADAPTCGLCGHEPPCGPAAVTTDDGHVHLCHADDHSCYHRWTVYGERPGNEMPVPHEWFVSYKVTERAIVLQKCGEDEHTLSPGEALRLRDDLLAAVVAEGDHRDLLEGR